MAGSALFVEERNEAARRRTPKPRRAVAERGVELRGIERTERGAKAHAAGDEALHDVGRDCVEERLEGLFAHADFFRRDYGFRPAMVGESGCCARHASLIYGTYYIIFEGD